MTIDKMIRIEKLQYNIKWEVAKSATLSSCKTDKNEYLTCEEILSPGSSQIMQ